MKRRSQLLVAELFAMTSLVVWSFTVGGPGDGLADKEKGMLPASSAKAKVVNRFNRARSPAQIPTSTGEKTGTISDSFQG